MTEHEHPATRLSREERNEGDRVLTFIQQQQAVADLRDGVRASLNAPFNVRDGEDTGGGDTLFRDGARRQAALFPPGAQVTLAREGVLPVLAVTVLNAAGRPAREFTGAIIDPRFVVRDPSTEGVYHDRRWVGQSVSRIGFESLPDDPRAPTGEGAFVYVATDTIGTSTADETALAGYRDALLQAQSGLQRFTEVVRMHGGIQDRNASILVGAVRTHLGLPPQ